MPPVAETARSRNRAIVLAMSPAERMSLALQLGDDAVAMFARLHGVLPDEARRRLARQRQRGRAVSAVARAREHVG